MFEEFFNQTEWILNNQKQYEIKWDSSIDILKWVLNYWNFEDIVSSEENIDSLLYALNDVKEFFNEIYNSIKEIAWDNLNVWDMWKRIEKEKIERLVKFFTWLWSDSVKELKIEIDYEKIIDELSEKIYTIKSIKKWIETTIKNLNKIKNNPSIRNNFLEFSILTSSIEQEISNIVNFFNWINYEFLRENLSKAYTITKLEKEIIKINGEIWAKWDFAILVDGLLWPHIIYIDPKWEFKVLHLI